MMFRNNVVLLPTIDSLFKVLQSPNTVLPPPTPCLYCDRFAIKHCKKQEMNIVRIWKTKSFMDWWYDDFSSKQFIGAIDYTIHDDKLKIDFMDINDITHNKNDYLMNAKESVKLNQYMIEFVIEQAKENNKNKIVVDVHNNLRIFNAYYKPEGFQITERKAEGNRFWLEAEYIICR